MTLELKNLETKLLWDIFGQICRIPRPSKHEKQIIDFVRGFGQNLGLETVIDAVGNVIIRKPATNGLEHLPMVVLQSHMDMVCEKNRDVVHDFLNDSIATYTDGEWMKAKGTTLGADNGIGMAAQLAVLASKDVRHGALECLFTVDEETGLTGANAIQPGFIKSSILLNLDSEEEGEFTIGCAGGIDTVAKFEQQKEPAPEGTVTLKIEITGLNGGHSGEDINKGLGNANKILARFLYLAQKEHGFRLSEIDGGNLRNAIAREAWMIGTIPTSQKEPIRISFNIFSHETEEELKRTEPKLKMTLGSVDSASHVMTHDLQLRLSQALMACPHGVIEMSRSIPGLVETSTNLASIKTKDAHIEVTTSQRSSMESTKVYVAEMVKSVFQLAGAEVEHSDGYPGWAPKTDSAILKACTKRYSELFGTAPHIKAIHAGLECGLFLTKYTGLDMISFGPTILAPHSPDERVNIESVGKFWQFLCAVLANPVV